MFEQPGSSLVTAYYLPFAVFAGIQLAGYIAGPSSVIKCCSPLLAWSNVLTTLSQDCIGPVTHYNVCCYASLSRSIPTVLTNTLTGPTRDVPTFSTAYSNLV